MVKFVALMSFVLSAIPCLECCFAQANTPGGEFTQVQASFGSGKYEDALRQLAEHPTEDASYYYNLGTILLKLKQAGKSLAFLEKANRLHPHDSSIQQNLLIARNTLSQSLGRDRLDPSSTWLETMADRLRLDEIRGALGLTAFTVALFWIRSYLKTRRLRETLLKPAGWIGVSALFITLGLYGIERWANLNPVAICLEHTIVRSGPGDTYFEVIQVEAGTKLRALGPTSESLLPAANPTTPGTIWRQIRYSADGIGWVKASNILLL